MRAFFGGIPKANGNEICRLVCNNEGSRPRLHDAVPAGLGRTTASGIPRRTLFFQALAHSELVAPGNVGYCKESESEPPVSEAPVFSDITDDPK